MAMRTVLNATMAIAAAVTIGAGATSAYMIYQNDAKAAQTRQLNKQIKKDKVTTKEQYTKINWYNLALVENKIQGNDVKISSPVIDGYNHIQKVLNDTQKAFNDHGGKLYSDGRKIPKSKAYKKIWNNEYLQLFDTDNVDPSNHGIQYVPIVATDQKADYFVDTGNTKADGTVTYLIRVTSSDKNQGTSNYIVSYDLQRQKITSMTMLGQPSTAKGLD